MTARLLDQLITHIVPFRFAKWWVKTWARMVRVSRNPKIIAITGSAGKTTTKEMIAAVLMTPEAKAILGCVEKTAGNANNVCGVSVTFLRLPMWGDGLSMLRTLLRAPFRALALRGSSPYPEYFVLECGTSQPGTIKEIALLAQPRISIVTNIGPAHLEGLGNLEGVMREKAALVEEVPSDGLVVLGSGHAFVGALARRARAPVIVCEGRGLELSREIARSVAHRVGIPSEVVEDALARYVPIAGRLRRIEFSRYTLIDDAYNANPLSMKYGLDVLRQTTANRRVAILGNMAELGDGSQAYHREVGTYARTCVDTLIAVGDEAREYGADYWFSSAEDLIMAIEGFLRPDDVILVKGSHSMHLEKVVEHLISATHVRP